MPFPNNNQLPNGMDMPNNGQLASSEQFPTNGELPTDGQMPNFGGQMGGGMNLDSNGADLVWNGYDIENYSAIFDNVEFKDTTTDDYDKILDMIEHLDTLEDIESYLNVDEK